MRPDPPTARRWCLQDGVTGWIDAGSQGADHIADAIAVARTSPQQGRVLINIGRAGILPEGDTMDLARADVGAARDAIARNRDFIVGVKARLSRDVAGAERLRGAAARAGSGGVFRPAGDDPHGADDLAARRSWSIS